MLTDLLEKKESKKMLYNIYNSKRYNDKKINSKHTVIGLFYDAIYKYKILINDNNNFNKYIEEIDILYRKINNVEDIYIGINKVLSRIIKTTITSNKIEYINYIYNKYIENGYLIHSFNSSYIKEIEENNFIPGIYNNLYDEYKEISKVLDKYNCNYLDKDFDDKSIYLTDNFSEAYFYSLRTPMYFYNYICKALKTDTGSCYKEKDLKASLNNIKKIIYKYNISKEDSIKIINLFNKTWELLKLEESFNAFLLVKRNKLNNKIDLTEFINENQNKDYDIILTKLLNVSNNIKYNNIINKEDIIIIELKPEKKEEKIEEYYKDYDFINDYGSVSILLIISSIIISMGVIIATFNIL